MKIKKIIGCVLAFTTVLALASCDNNNVAKVTLVDENGEEKVVELKKSAAKEDVVNALTYVGYADYQSFEGLKLQGDANVEFAGTAVANSDVANAMEALDVNLAVNTKCVLSGDTVYAEASAKGTNNSTGTQAKVDSLAKAYYGPADIYGYLYVKTLKDGSETEYDELKYKASTILIETLLSNYVGSYLPSVGSGLFLPSSGSSTLFPANTSASDSYDDFVKTMPNSSLEISNVSNDKITLSAKLSANDIIKSYNTTATEKITALETDSTMTFNASFNISNALLANVSFDEDLTSLVAKLAASEVTITKAKAKVSFSIEYGTFELPTLAPAEKTSYVDILAGLLGN